MLQYKKWDFEKNKLCNLIILLPRIWIKTSDIYRNFPIDISILHLYTLKKSLYCQT